MPSLPISLFEKIPELNQTLGARRNLCLIFNFECFDTSHRTQNSQNLNSIQRYIHWIADLPDVTMAILSNGTLEELKVFFDNRRIILAPNNGAEIHSSSFNWVQPDLNLIRSELTELFTAVRESVGSDLRPEHLSFSQGELWLKVSAGAKMVREILIKQYNALKTTRLRLSIVNQQVIVSPDNPWNRGRAIQKIFDLIPRAAQQAPTIIYFGLEDEDEPAFQIVNNLGLSVIIYNRLPRTTNARYFLRNSAELRKFLFWVHSR